jgi:tetratricopeptide (TPR) repeat protein
MHALKAGGFAKTESSPSLRLTARSFFVVFAVLCAFASARWAVAAESIDSLQARIRTSQDPAEQARLYKELGEEHVSRDQLSDAGDAFVKALSLARDKFSLTERTRMAIYLSWADRLDESAKELELVLRADPKNVAARTHLARVLSWSGELSEAITQAEMVLRDAPDHKEAQLVKANALQWQGHYGEAIPIYQKLVGTEVDFDARLGIVHSFLALGRRKAAQENAGLLKPANPREERELKRLAEIIDRETRPKIDLRYNFYRDSDHNRLHRYLFLSDFWLGDQNLGFNYRHTDANDKTRENRAEDLSLKFYSPLTDTIGAGASLGFTQLGDGHTSNFPIGQLRVDAKLFRGTVGANLTREVISDTAELIENRIRLTHLGLYLSQPLTDRFSVYAGYAYKDFSDGNHANDLQLVSQYALYLNPRIAIGHRFRFLDFSQQSHSGFFDPNNYIANRAFTSFYIERAAYYTYLEGFLGHQTFRRDGVASDDFVKGGSGSIGIKPFPNLAVEVNAEGGNFAAGSAAGFTYFIVGPRLLFRF